MNKAKANQTTLSTDLHGSLKYNDPFTFIKNNTPFKITTNELFRTKESEENCFRYFNLNDFYAYYESLTLNEKTNLMMLFEDIECGLVVKHEQFGSGEESIIEITLPRNNYKTRRFDLPYNEPLSMFIEDYMNGLIIFKVDIDTLLIFLDIPHPEFGILQ